MSKQTYYGCFLKIDNIGTLITGESGIGKSETALALIDRGQQLIADDIVELNINNQQLIGNCPKETQDYLEIRNLGFINIRKLYGNQAICLQQPLNLIIELSNQWLQNDKRAKHPFQQQTILNHTFPKLVLTAIPGRNLPLLIETGVKLFKSLQQGDNFHQDLLNQMEFAES